MRVIGKSVLAATAGAAVLAFSAVNASAVVVCASSVCWHSQERYDYPSSAHVVIHEDNWKWRKNEHYRWREHSGRGYWSGSRWSNW
jgi:hypothetical protein